MAATTDTPARSPPARRFETLGRRAVTFPEFPRGPRARPRYFPRPPPTTTCSPPSSTRRRRRGRALCVGCVGYVIQRYLNPGSLELLADIANPRLVIRALSALARSLELDGILWRGELCPSGPAPGAVKPPPDRRPTSWVGPSRILSAAAQLEHIRLHSRCSVGVTASGANRLRDRYGSS